MYGAQAALSNLRVYSPGGLHQRSLRLTPVTGDSQAQETCWTALRVPPHGAAPAGAAHSDRVRLYLRASGDTAAQTAGGVRSGGDVMNGKHGFTLDDAWDAGSNGVGGHPPVALITTLGCPHCKRVGAGAQTPYPVHGDGVAPDACPGYG